MRGFEIGGVAGKKENVPVNVHSGLVGDARREKILNESARIQLVEMYRSFEGDHNMIFTEAQLEAFIAFANSDVNSHQLFLKEVEEYLKRHYLMRIDGADGTVGYVIKQNALDGVAQTRDGKVVYH
jgi:hypothetical protein